MDKRTPEIEAILMERFARDSIIALATSIDNVPHVRNVDAFYEDGAFYILTHALSGKMRQIAQNPTVAVAGDWFTGQGTAVHLGAFSQPENTRIAAKMRQIFATWIDNGHTDLTDGNTCILCIRLTSGVLFDHGVRYDIDFT